MTTTGVGQWAKHKLNFAKGFSNRCVYCYSAKIQERTGNEISYTTVANAKKVYTKYRKKNDRIMTPTGHCLPFEIIKDAVIVYRQLLKVGNNLLITTKPDYHVIRVLCKKFPMYKKQILFRFTITAISEKTTKLYEPNAPLFPERLRSLIHAYEKGFKTSISIEPFLEDPIPIIQATLPYVTDTIWIGPMNLKYCPKDLQKDIWKPRNLKILKTILDSGDLVDNSKIRYKDSFINALKEVKQ